MMKILMVSEISLFPLTGGVQRHVFSLAKFMKRQGHEVDILTSGSKPSAKKEVVLNGVRIIKTLRPFSHIYFYNRFQWIYNSYELMKQINDHGKKYDIIHYHGGCYYFLKFLNLDKPLVSTLHGIYPACVMESYLFDLCKSPSPPRCALCHVARNPSHALLFPGVLTFCILHHELMKKGLQRMQKIICVSDYVRRMVKKTLELDNLVTIHNFINFQEEIKPKLALLKDFDARKLLNIPTDSRIIVYFGRLSYEKGIDILTKAFSEVLTTLSRKVYLIIGGTGPQKRRIEEISKRINNVKIVGYLPRSKQLGLMAQSDVFVNPARFADACPTTLIEASSLGLPIVATRVGGSPEIVENGNNGLLVKPQSSKALASGLIKLLSDERMLGKYRRKGPQKAKNFDISVIGHKVLSLYDEVLSH